MQVNTPYIECLGMEPYLATDSSETIGNNQGGMGEVDEVDFIKKKHRRFPGTFLHL